MPWGAAIGAGASLLGSSMASKASGDAARESAEINKAPWKGQQPYVLDGYGKVQSQLNTALGMGNYQGQYAADLNPWQSKGWDTAANFADNQGTQGANTVFNSGMSNIGQASAFGDNAAAMFSRAGSDPTQQIIGNAGQYANNPYLNSQIDAASRDVVRNLNENQLTGLDLSAAGGGNMNSSRTGVAQAIMQRGAGDRIADISANMRGNAYNNGLGMAQGQYNAGMGQMLGANGQLLQAGQFGADQIGNGLNLGYGAGDVMTRAGAGYQAQNQTQLDAARQQFADQQNNAMDLTGKYMGILNGNFSTGGGSAIQPVDRFGSIASGAMAGMSLYGKWNQGKAAGNTGTAYQNTWGDLPSGVDNLGTTGDYNMGGMDFGGGGYDPGGMGVGAWA